MTDAFRAAIGYVLSNEGGASNDPADHGGWTVYGLSRRAFPNEPWPPPYARALELYEEFYWQPIGGDLLVSQPIATKTLDTCVVCGVRTGVILLQRALHSLGQLVQIDGALGPQTRTAIEAACERLGVLAVLHAYAGIIAERVRGIVAADASQQPFLAGWLRRAQRLPVD